MNINTKHLFLAGNIVHGEINWYPPVAPADGELFHMMDDGERAQQLADDVVDAAFGAPATVSYFAHLFPKVAPAHELVDARDDEEFNRWGC